MVKLLDDKKRISLQELLIKSPYIQHECNKNEQEIMNLDYKAMGHNFSQILCH